MRGGARGAGRRWFGATGAVVVALVFPIVGGSDAAAQVAAGSNPGPGTNAAPIPPAPGGQVVWAPIGRQVLGRALVYTATVDGVTVFWMDPQLLRPVLVPGTNDPQGAANPWGSQIAPNARPQAVAAFNGGFQMRDVGGGFFAWGQVWRVLAPGDASLVVYADGHASVAQWGRDATMSSDVVGVRQNLTLLVDGGRPVPAVTNPGSWGASVAGVATARSGVGIDANGALVVAMARVSPAGLADALIAAGAVRAMQMDINPAWTSFVVYDGDASGTTSGVRVGGTGGPTGLYLSPSGRDFVAVLLRSTVVPGGTGVVGLAPLGTEVRAP